MDKEHINPLLKQNDNKPVDLTRLNRADRRRISKKQGIKIMGRTLPYVKAIHGTYEKYYKLLAEEEEKDYNNRK